MDNNNNNQNKFDFKAQEHFTCRKQANDLNFSQPAKPKLLANL